MKSNKKISSGIFGLRFNFVSYLLIILPILFLALSMMEYFNIFKFDIPLRRLFAKEEYFWFFSTAAQAMAALFGIGGMFTAFVLQSINNKYDKNFEYIRDKSKELLGDSYADEELLKKTDEWINVQENKNKSTRYYYVKKVREDMKKYEAKKDEIKKAFKTMLVFMASVVVISLLALPISFSLEWTDLGPIFGFFFMLLMLFTVWKLARFTFESIKD